MKQNILVFTTTYPTFKEGDSTPSFVHELSSRLVDEETNITVLTPRRIGTKSFEEKEGVQIYRYKYFFHSSLEKLCEGAIMPNLKKNKFLYLQVPFLIISGFFSLIFLTKNKNISYIHAHWIFPNGWIASIVKKYFLNDKKLIITSHGSDLHTLKGSIVDKIKIRTIKQADIISVVSKSHLKILRELMGFQCKAYVIPMGVDKRKFSKTAKDIFLRKEFDISGLFLLNVGRLAPEKGQVDLIKAMPEIVKDYPKSKLVIIGEGPLESDLKKLSSKLHMEKNIHFLGPLENNELPKWYATCDVFIMSSIKESYGIVLAEAISCGAKVLARNLDAFKDFNLKNYETFENFGEISKKIHFIKKNSHNSYNVLSWEVVTNSFSNIFGNNVN